MPPRALLRVRRQLEDELQDVEALAEKLAKLIVCEVLRWRHGARAVRRNAARRGTSIVNAQGLRSKERTPRA